MLDFDNSPNWCPELSKILFSFLPQDINTLVLEAKPEYVSDAADTVFHHFDGGKRNAIEVTSEWLKKQSIMGYHGTRLSDDEVKNIKAEGLKKCAAHDRLQRLESKFHDHPKWEDIKSNLPEIIEKLSNKNYAGVREGQVHLTASKAGLVNSFNHYLTHGSEYDIHAADLLLGDDGRSWLARYASSRLISAKIPGEQALKAANPYGTLTGNDPNFIREIIETWSYQLAHPEFIAESLEIDCGFIFKEDVPAEWIHDIVNVDISHIETDEC